MMSKLISESHLSLLIWRDWASISLISDILSVFRAFNSLLSEFSTKTFGVLITIESWIVVKKRTVFVGGQSTKPLVSTILIVSEGGHFVFMMKGTFTGVAKTVSTFVMRSVKRRVSVRGGKRLAHSVAQSVGFVVRQPIRLIIKAVKTIRKRGIIFFF